MSASAPPAPEPSLLRHAPLVQREQQAKLLTHSLTGPPAFVFVEGEAGVGKTRLVREVLAQVQQAQPNTRILTGQCHPQQHPFLLLPLVDAVRAEGTTLRTRRLSPVTGALRLLLPELSDTLPSAPPIAEPGAARHQVFRGLAALLHALAPAIVILEDMHWADPGTSEFLHFMVTQPGPLPHFVLTYRR